VSEVTPAPPVIGNVIRAAGLVVLRRAAEPADPHSEHADPEADPDVGRGLESLEVLAVHRPRYQDWSLPKGKLEPGEHPLAAAVREVHEETGVRAVPGRSLSGTRYLEPDGRTKTVDWWLASVAAQDERDADDEVDEVRWLPAAAAGAQLTHSMDGDLLAGVAGLLDRGSAADARALLARPVILVRHASARSRKSWDGPELQRPLDDDGLAQADLLIGLLRALAPRRIVCSTAWRCQQTVRPFAAAAGLDVELEQDLTEQAFDDDGDRPRSVLRRLVTDRDAGPVLVCTHRPVLGPLLAEATGQRRQRADERPLHTAEVAVLSGTYRHMYAERYPTPAP
jgi:8-oxo-dGTP pyrophosphatase MutT (NUDIX family)/phosphohistidine phosphatase SixA